ncbi:hypothetical protein RB596_000761 [Gaeumannomyces avenae]
MSGDNSSHPAYRLLQPLASTQSASDAAKPDITKVVAELTELVQRSIVPGGDLIGDVLWDVWSAVFQVAADTPHQSQSDGLVDFMTQLRKTTVSSPGGAAVLADENQKVWDDIPQFGWVARDIWNFSPSDTSATAAQQESFNNQTAFLARLTLRADVERVDKRHPFDYSMYALWSMRDAFEEPSPNQQAQDKTPAIKNAAVWLRYAGARLRDLSMAGSNLPDRTGVAGDLHSDKNWKGFQQDRWAVWKNGFEAALDEDKIDAETREMIKKGMELV